MPPDNESAPDNDWFTDSRARVIVMLAEARADQRTLAERVTGIEQRTAARFDALEASNVSLHATLDTLDGKIDLLIVAGAQRSGAERVGTAIFGIVGTIFTIVGGGWLLNLFHIGPGPGH